MSTETEKLQAVLDAFFDARNLDRWSVDAFLLLQVEQQQLNDPPEGPQWYNELMQVIRAKGLVNVGQGKYDSADLLAFFREM